MESVNITHRKIQNDEIVPALADAHDGIGSLPYGCVWIRNGLNVIIDQRRDIRIVVDDQTFVLRFGAFGLIGWTGPAGLLESREHGWIALRREARPV